jgi:hypothetical protein
MGEKNPGSSLALMAGILYLGEAYTVYTPRLAAAVNRLNLNGI